MSVLILSLKLFILDLFNEPFSNLTYLLHRDQRIYSKPYYTTKTGPPVFFYYLPINNSSYSKIYEIYNIIHIYACV